MASRYGIIKNNYVCLTHMVMICGFGGVMKLYFIIREKISRIGPVSLHPSSLSNRIKKRFFVSQLQHRPNIALFYYETALIRVEGSLH